MDPEEAVAQLGGVARTDQLLRWCTERQLRAAVTAGRIVRMARGRYAHASADKAARHAVRLHGTIVGPSAAQQHGWELARPPVKPWIAVPRNRKVPAGRRRGVHLLYSDVRGSVSDPMTTVLDCARRLPFDEALAVADSALRSGQVEHDELVTAAAGVAGLGAAQCRRVAAEATPLAANPFESALRAIALDVPGLRVRPQVELTLAGRVVYPDLLDEELGLVIEADSWLYHASTPQSFIDDLWRYTTMTTQGLTVARFGHSHVMDDQAWVRDCLTALVQTCKRHVRCRPAA